MKKILFIIPSLGGGGAERMFTKIVNWVYNHFQNIEISVLLITSKGINYEKLPKDIKIDILNINRIPFSLFKINNYIRNNKPDVVFSTITQLNIVLSLVKIFNNFKLITRETNVITEEFKLKDYPFFYLWLYKLNLKVSDCVIFQSNDMAQDALKNANLDNYTIINNSIDICVSKGTHKKQDENKELKLISIGRLEKQKGYDLLIDSLSVEGKDLKYHLDIYGQGSEYNKLNQQIKNNGLSNCIELKGFHHDVMSLINNYDLFILSSRHEGFPNAVIEVLSQGLPVWSVNCKGGINEIINEKNGKIFNSTNELVFELRKFNSYTYDDKKISLDVYKKYSDSIIKAKYIYLFEKLL